MRLSVVDLGVIAPGTDQSQGLADSLAFARHVERLGFHRIWFAEHHANAMGASHNPELLIAAAGAVTSRIRVGSGAVLMNHYSPFKVAETFAQLEAMYPDRVDLGMGRATGGPIVDMALQRDREHPHDADQVQQVAETLAWLYREFPAQHPFSRARILPHPPQTWLLGSSLSSARLAAALGIGYVFAGFIAPAAATAALRAYRQEFRPSGHGIEAPRAILAVNVTVGETAAEARRLVASPIGYYARLRSGDVDTRVPAAEVALSELSAQEQSVPTAIVGGRWPQFVAGDPRTVRATLEQMAAESQADEMMIQNLIPDPADRHVSHTLLAREWGLCVEGA